jgi:hypothetical protein
LNDGSATYIGRIATSKTIPYMSADGEKGMMRGK